MSEARCLSLIHCDVDPIPNAGSQASKNSAATHWQQVSGLTCEILFSQSETEPEF